MYVFTCVMIFNSQAGRVGPLECVSVHDRDGPFGSSGTVMWLCEHHKKMVQDWNDRKITERQAREQAMAFFASQSSTV
jgi:hypothetical protein